MCEGIRAIGMQFCCCCCCYFDWRSVSFRFTPNKLWKCRSLLTLRQLQHTSDKSAKSHSARPMTTGLAIRGAIRAARVRVCVCGCVCVSGCYCPYTVFVESVTHTHTIAMTWWKVINASVIIVRLRNYSRRKVLLGLLGKHLQFFPLPSHFSFCLLSDCSPLFFAPFQ